MLVGFVAVVDVVAAAAVGVVVVAVDAAAAVAAAAAVVVVAVGVGAVVGVDAVGRYCFGNIVRGRQRRRGDRGIERKRRGLP